MRISSQTIAVLHALQKSTRAWTHGYELSRITGLKSGTLYPILLRLHDEGWLEAKWELFQRERGTMGLMWIRVDQAEELRMTHGAQACELMLENVGCSVGQVRVPAKQNPAAQNLPPPQSESISAIAFVGPGTLVFGIGERSRVVARSSTLFLLDLPNGKPRPTSFVVSAWENRSNPDGTTST